MTSAVDASTVQPVSQVQVVGEICSDGEGQVILSNKLLSQIGVRPNVRMKVLREGNRLVVVDAAAYAISKFREGMKGEAERLGLKNDDDVFEFLNKLRHEENAD